MSDLRTAAQQALEALEFSTLDAFMLAPISPGRESTIKAITALRAALAEPAQEPVAWLAPKTVDSYMRPDLGYETCSKTDYAAFPVYTAPPQRKPLTEWQINDLMANIDPEDVDSWSFRQGVYATEKHHGVRP